MIIEGYKGYREGQDILQIPADYLTYPSKNCITYKGKIISRLGLKNDGTAHTENTGVHSEYVWKKAPGGTKTLRVWGSTLQVKLEGKWVTIFSGFASGTTRVRFTSWIDTNGTIIKSRLFMVDGSENIYEWSGAVAPIGSIAGAVVTINSEKTLLQLGFDPGNVTTRDVLIARVDADYVPQGVETYEYTDTLAGNDDITLTSTPSPTPDANDWLIQGVITHTNQLSGIDKDEIYTYKNHLFTAELESGRIYYSHASDYLVFTIPGTGTSITAGTLDLDGQFTAMIERKGVLWISTTDDWYKVTKAVEANAYGFFTEIEKFEQAESVGAKAFAVAIQKGDVVFMGADKRLRRIITLEVLGIDDIELISDQIDGLLDRLTLEDVRIYYHQRYIFIISADESVTLMLDIIEKEYMPPQYIGMSCMSIINNVRYGHSNGRNETFELFSGRDDLGGEIEVVVAPGFTHGKQNFTPKKHDMFGMHARATATSTVALEYQYEEYGSNVSKQASFAVADIRTYELPYDASFGSNPLGRSTFAGVDDNPDTSLKGFFLFDRQEMVSWFDFRPVYTISGTDVEFHLLAWWINEAVSDDNIPQELFINRS